MKTMPILMAVAAMLSFASCSEDEPVDTNRGRAIDFRPVMGGRSRGAETTNANLSSMNVTAFMGDSEFFPDMEFSRSSDGFFKSAQEYYWPGDDSELTFYAYSPSVPGGKVTIDNTAKEMTDFSPAAEIANQIDFITATATGKKSTNEENGVELTFNHRLAQIEVCAKTGDELYNFEVTGVRIGQPVSVASFDFGTLGWTLGSDKAIYEETYTTPKVITATATSVMGDGGNAMLIPQQLTAWDPAGDATNTAKGAYLSVKLKITTAATGVQVYPFPTDGDCDWAAIPIDTDWQPGNKYIYTLDFTHGAGNVDPKDPKPGIPVLGDDIKFTVDVIPWNGSNQDISMETK